MAVLLDGLPSKQTAEKLADECQRREKRSSNGTDGVCLGLGVEGAKLVDEALQSQRCILYAQYTGLPRMPPKLAVSKPNRMSPVRRQKQEKSRTGVTLECAMLGWIWQWLQTFIPLILWLLFLIYCSLDSLLDHFPAIWGFEGVIDPTKSSAAPSEVPSELLLQVTSTSLMN